MFCMKRYALFRTRLKMAARVGTEKDGPTPLSCVRSVAPAVASSQRAHEHLLLPGKRSSTGRNSGHEQCVVPPASISAAAGRGKFQNPKPLVPSCGGAGGVPRDQEEAQGVPGALPEAAGGGERGPISRLQGRSVLKPDRAKIENFGPLTRKWNQTAGIVLKSPAIRWRCAAGKCVGWLSVAVERVRARP